MRYADLVPGKWYAVGFEIFSTVDTPYIDYATIAQFHGNKEWTDDNGEQIESFWDPELQMPVAVDAAEDYALQG